MRTTLIAAASLAFALSSSAWALTLGEVDVDSALNQQLSATIPVTGIGPEERDTLRAAIASERAFARAGLRRDSLFDDVKVDLIQGPGADRATVKLQSKRRVSEPFLSFLVELRWAGGGTIREYTVLLDPPNLAQASRGSSGAPAASESMESSGSGFIEDDSGITESIGPGSAESAPVRRSSSGDRSGRSYGPIGRQETLWSIAYAQRSGSSITMDQMQLAIFRANPQAFDGNMNRMLRGVMLQIPDESEIRAVSPGSAKAEVARQKTSSYGGRSTARRASPSTRRASTPPRRERVATPAVEPSEPVVESQAEAQVAVEPAEKVPAPPPADKPATPPVEAPVLAPATDDSTMATTTPGGVDAETPSSDAAAAQGSSPTEGSAPAPATDAASAAGGVDPEMPATAAAGADTAPGQSENLQMPSIWAEGEQPPPGEQSAQPPAEAPVDAGTGGGLAGIMSAVGEFKMLLLGLVAVLALLAVMVIYRRRQQSEAETPPLPTIEFESTNVADLEQGLPQAPTAVWQGESEMPTPSRAASTEPEEITSTFDFDSLLSGVPAPQKPARPAAATRSSSPAAVPPMSRTGVMQAQPIPVRDTDYLGEAELHIAYGLYDEAAAVLKRGVQENPRRQDLWMKLLEVHAEAKNGQDYVMTAGDFRQKAQPSDADWAKVAAKGKELVPDAPLFAGGGKSSRSATTELDLGAAFDLPPGEAAPAPRAAAKPPGKTGTIEFDLADFDAPKAASAPAAAPSKPAPGMQGMDIDLSSFDTALGGKANAAAPIAKADAEADLTADLDFQLNDAPAGAAAAKTGDTAISLEDFAAAETGGSAGDEEASVKLDLARAYLDMGETDMARGLLQEVASNGSAQQKKEAQDLLTRA
ncbi:MAG: FimV/HubP family polar landmark protein [Nevskiales bacterium]